MSEWRTASIMFDELLEAEPSTPRPIVTPAASSSFTGQTPMPNAMSDAAQWQTLTPALPKRSISLALKWIPCATQARGLSHPASSRRSTERMPNVSTA